MTTPAETPRPESTKQSSEAVSQAEQGTQGSSVLEFAFEAFATKREAWAAGYEMGTKDAEQAAQASHDESKISSCGAERSEAGAASAQDLLAAAKEVRSQTMSAERWVLLEVDRDVMCEGDEQLTPPHLNWTRVPDECIGQPVTPDHYPIRRRYIASAAQGSAQQSEGKAGADERLRSALVESSAALKAEALARRAHAGQVDKAGRPYIEHVARVAAAVESYGEDAQAVAWLHDVLEDCDAECGQAVMQFPDHIKYAVTLLTRCSDQDCATYYAEIQSNPIALCVKLADIADNADETRLALLDEATAARLRKKYAAARMAMTREEVFAALDRAYNAPIIAAESPGDERIRGVGTEIRRARATIEALYAENERLRLELKESARDSFIKERISYRGFSYGTASQYGIDSLRNAINRFGDA